MREYVVENEFVKAVKKAGGVAYKLTSQTTNGLPDRLVLFFPAKTVFVELKAPGRVLRPLQRKRRYQLQKLGFPVLCIDRLSQIGPAIQAILDWDPGEPFPEGVGAAVPELDISDLPTIPGAAESLADLDDFGETLEPEDPSELAFFFNLDNWGGDTDGAAAAAVPAAIKRGGGLFYLNHTTTRAIALSISRHTRLRRSCSIWDLARR
mgnify:CR=1 FL=1